jgi:hypothetical protein
MKVAANKTRLLLGAVSLIVAGLIIITVISSAATPVFAQLVTICHHGREINVGISAVPSHLSHGDFIGPCPP